MTLGRRVVESREEGFDRRIDEGFLDRRCPSDECGADFKVHIDHWKQKVSQERAYCPVCGMEANASQWNTPEQHASFRMQANRFVSNTISSANAKDAANFNRSQPRGGFVSVRMEHRPGRVPPGLPASASSVLEQRFVCSECDCSFASIGASFFCPACSHNSADQQFEATLVNVKSLIERLETVSANMAQQFGLDDARNFERFALENSICKLVGAFQRYAEARYSKLSSSPPPRRNAFQNLSEGSKLWEDTTGASFESIVGSDGMARLQVYFQQRHILEHRDGFVDQDYIAKSGDSAYQVGQRLVIKATAVADFIENLQTLAAGLR